MNGRVILTLVLAGCGCLAPADEQWLKNPDMSLQDGKPAGWRYYDFKTGGEGLVSKDGGRGASSAVGVRAETAEQRGAWMQRIAIGDHRFVNVAGWYRTDGLKPAQRKGATVRMSYRGKSTFHGDHRHYLAPADSWTRFEFTDRVLGDDSAVEIELFNFFLPGTVWFDDVTCRPGTAAAWAGKAGQNLDRPPGPDQAGYAPEQGDVLRFTPPAFRWVPIRGAEEYRVQWSRAADFAPDTVEDRRSAICIYTPHAVVEPGKWWWRYGLVVEGTDAVVWSRSREFVIAEEPLQFPRPRTTDVVTRVPTRRPRVYFTPELLDRVRAGTDPTLREMVARTVRSAEKQLGKELYPEPAFLPKERTARRNKYQEIFRSMRPWTAGMETCALAYLLTGETRFAEEAKRRLLHYASWDPQGSTSVFHNDEPAMDLAMRGPRTFDWVHDVLSEQERRKCIEAWRVRLGDINRLHRRTPFESRPFSSHHGRMVPFVVEGSIVFCHEIPEARDWLEYTLHLMWNTYPAWGSADGGWHEGPGYWGAYIGMLTRNVYGFGDVGQLWKQKPFFRNTGYFGLYAVPAYARQLPFGDGHEGRSGRGHGSILYGLASLHDSRHFRWYAEVQGVRAMVGPEGFVAHRPELTPTPPVDLPQSRAFENIGVVAMHSDLADPAGSVQMLFKSDPYGSVSHNHASQNAFAINAFGQALAISSGYYQQYGCPHHAQWTWDTKAHNSVTIDGKGQKKRSRASRGRIARFWDDGNITFTTGDATAAYNGRLTRFHRHVVFLRPDTFVLVDDIAAPKDVSAEWWLHARSEMDIDEARQSVTITQGDARLTTQFLVPQGLHFAQTDKFPVTPHRADSVNQWHATATTPAKSAAPQFVSVLRAHRATEGMEPFRARVFKAEGYHCVQVRGPNTWDLVGVKRGGDDANDRGEALMVARWSKDGKTLQGYCGLDALAVEIENRVVIRSDQRVSASAEFGTSQARVVIEATADTECRLFVPKRYGEPAAADAVRVVERTEDRVTLAVPSGRHELVFPLAARQPVQAVALAAAGSARTMAATAGVHATAWCARTEGLPEGLQDAVVSYRAPEGSRLILTSGRSRHEWVAPGGETETRFRWLISPGQIPITLLNEHGLSPRAYVHSIRFEGVAATGMLTPALASEDTPGLLRIEAEQFVTHVGPADPIRRGKYVCSDALLYGIGDLVTRVDYDLDVVQAGTYELLLKHASDQTRTAISVELDEARPHAAAELMLFERTGGWGYDAKQWRVQRLCDTDGQPVKLHLSAGRHRLTLRGHGGRMHLDWFALQPVP